MEIPTKEDLLQLTESAIGPGVSIFMPTHRAGPDTRQDPIRLKNLITEAENRLQEEGVSQEDAKAMVMPLWGLQEDYEFWQHQSDGLAVFLNKESVVYYRVPIDLPELAVVGSRFHLKPLLPLVSADTLFHLLAISMNETTLFECTPYSQGEIKVPDMPDGMADVIFPGDSEKQVQFRSFYSGGSGNAALFHGAGGAEMDPKNDIVRYFREVDNALTPFLRRIGGPLVLACVDYLGPMYREANNYPELVTTANVSGSPDEAQPDKLREAAWEIIEPMFTAQREAALERYRSQIGTGKTTSDVDEAVLAAITGRVDTAFVTVGVRQWGKVDFEGYKVERHEEAQPGDYDLHDLTAVHTLAAGGTVYAFQPGQAPEESGIAALFRY